MHELYTELVITSIKDETPDTRSFVLASLSGKKIAYHAGQFLTFVFPHKVNENRRSYSISSTPYLSEPLTITVKRLDNGEFSRYLFDYCQVGSSLFTIGASGFFVLPAEPQFYSDYVFYAAGSGITPVLPLIKTLLMKFAHAKIRLTYSNHNREHTIFYDELNELREKYPGNFTIEWLFSDAKNLLRARLTKSLVEEQVVRHYSGRAKNTLFYLCGPYDYMRMISITLLREGIPQENIRKEIFDNIKPVSRRLPPDMEAHTVTLEYMQQKYSFTVKYPETILETAKRNGVVLPYSCEAGKCGTCAATCIDGEVWMSYNEVLLDKELVKGRVLTCTGFPVKGDVQLFYPPPGSEA